MTTIPPERLRSRKPRDHKPFDPRKVRYSPRWIGAGLGLSGLGLLAIKRGGWPVTIGLGATAIAGAAYARFIEPRYPKIEHVTVQLPDLPPQLDGLRIGQLSDFHLGHPYTHENTRWAVRQIMAEAPELLVLTGDFVSFDHAIAQLPEALDMLHAPLGCYAVLGNHDYWEGAAMIAGHLATHGTKLLLNQHQLLEWRGTTFAIAGLDDIWDGTPDMDQALKGLPANTFTLLLCHAPDFAQTAAHYPVALQFSGHTHGGHMQFPGLGSFCLPMHGVNFAAGLYPVGRMQLYVSRGLGGMPLRFGCRPEATIVTLRKGA